MKTYEYVIHVFISGHTHWFVHPKIVLLTTFMEVFTSSQALPGDIPTLIVSTLC